ncbi:MAG: transporter substrate-binding domain-containing protein [Dongiaceae bacterium]
MKFGFLIEPPFNYRLADGTVTGCDVELAKTILAQIGDGKFEPAETEFAELLPGVAAGRWRMTTGLFATEERKKMASFSRPIWALADGLLVRKGNPKALTGYRAIAGNSGAQVAAIRGQVQHDAAVQFGVPGARIRIFEAYGEAAEAVARGTVDAYASVARAHFAFCAQHPELDLEVLRINAAEKEPAFGCFAFAKHDDAFRHDFDQALKEYLGSKAHRAMMARFGFGDEEIDLIAG